MSERTPWAIYVAVGGALGVIGAYLIAGGAAYRPLQVADPCEPRPVAVLAHRGVLEGVVLSGLDGAACELQVTREELLAALADDEALNEFTARYGIEPDEVNEAVRAGLVRAVDDAEREGLISGLPAALARAIADNAPIGTALGLFRAIPGTPTLPQMLQAIADAGVTLEELDELFGERAEDLRLLLEDLLDGFNGAFRDLRDLAPEGLRDLDLDQLDGFRDLDLGDLGGRDSG